MINKHLWPVRGQWTMGEERKCEKCGMKVKFIRVPRRGSMLFSVTDKSGKVFYGQMPKCEP